MQFVANLTKPFTICMIWLTAQVSHLSLFLTYCALRDLGNYISEDNVIAADGTTSLSFHNETQFVPNKDMLLMCRH